MPQTTLILNVDDPHYKNDFAALKSWFKRNNNRITSNSGDTGCQCCVNIWDVECDDVAMADLPGAFLSPDTTAKEPG